jgi:ribonuclease P protein component
MVRLITTRFAWPACNRKTITYRESVSRLLKTQSFPKSRRLLTNRSFKQVIEAGARAGDGLLVVYACPNGLDYSRIGISLGRSRGGAVVRNRLKRLIREAFRLNSDRIPSGFDYVVLVGSNWPKKISGAVGPADAAKKLTLAAVADSLVTLADRAHRDKR